MADVDAAPPPPELVPKEQPQAVESASADQEEPAAGEVDLKRKLEEVEPGTEANGTGEDAKRPRVDGEPDGAGVEQQSNDSSVEVVPEDSKVAPTERTADAANGEAAPDVDEQAVQHAASDEKPTEPTPEAATEAPQQEGDVASAGQETSRKIEVPNSKVGVLIGKAGETIKNLQMSSGAKIQITKDVDADSTALTRPVELVGSLESIDKAEQLIKSVIAEAEAGGSPALIAKGFGSGQAGSELFEMTVPDNKVGIIIGKGGESIKSLQTRSGARIQLIPQHAPAGTLTERTVRITGNKSQIEAAKDLIKQTINQVHAITADARLARSLWPPIHHHAIQGAREEDVFFDIRITSSNIICDDEKTSEQNHVVAAASLYDDVCSEVVGDSSLTKMQAFPQPPAPRLDRHMEIGDGSCNVGSEVRVFRVTSNLLHLLTWNVQSLHVHDTSTNIVMTPSVNVVSLKWCRVERCPMLDPVFPPEDDPWDLETIWASDLLMARCIWSKGPPQDHTGFRGLRHLHLRSCPSLQFALPIWSSSSFPMLETLHIIHCGSLRHVFALDNEKHGIKKNTSILFPELTTIHLHDVPALQQICETNNMITPKLKTIRTRGCWSLRRLPALGSSLEAGRRWRRWRRTCGTLWNGTGWTSVTTPPSTRRPCTRATTRAAAFSGAPSSGDDRCHLSAALVLNLLADRLLVGLLLLLLLRVSLLCANQGTGFRLAPALAAESLAGVLFTSISSQ